jgi:purine-binding chemotaxis protein CheW
MQPITKIPKTPEYMSGVIDVRGGAVPVIDLRLKLQIQQSEQTVDTCIIVLELGSEDESILVGAIVDSVQEVIAISEENIDPPPRFGTKLDIEYIEGISKQDEHFIMILNIEKIFTDTEISYLKQSTPQTSSTR